MKKESLSYIDAMYAVLQHKGWIHCSKSVLAGMSVSAFRFSVHRRLTADSTTAFNWMAENYLAADFLGFVTSQEADYTFNPTFPLYQREAIRSIKKSVDDQTGAVIWKDAFVVICGYDDDRQLFYYSDGTSEELQTMAYESFGRNISPYWYFQIFHDYVQLDLMEIYKESLLQAVYKWESHDLLLPTEDYACGRLAYDKIIQAFETGNYDREGAWEVLNFYSAAKHDISAYCKELQKVWKRCEEVAEQYAKAAGAFQSIRDIIHSCSDKRMMDEQATAIIPYLLKAQNAEEQAIQGIKALFHETISNRFDNISLR